MSVERQPNNSPERFHIKEHCINQNAQVGLHMGVFPLHLDGLNLESERASGRCDK